jgi:hypothetical protein
MKKNISFYSHYVNAHNHWKFKLLRNKYGWEAEGKFWALNNMIGNSDQCLLNLNKKNIRNSVAADLDFTLDEFDEWINFLEKECELIISLDGQIYTEIVREDYKRVMKEREAARIRKAKSQNSLYQYKLRLLENSQ